MIIGIVGTLGAGKGTVVEYLKSKGFAHYSSSAILKDLLKERGLPQTRAYMSPLANELMAKHDGGVLHYSHERARQEGAENFVLEAIHRTKEADYIKNIEGVVLGVDADIHKRYERVAKRKDGAKDNVTFEQFLADSKREEEGEANTGPHIRAVLDMADAVVMNNGTKNELFLQVGNALKSLEKQAHKTT